MGEYEFPTMGHIWLAQRSRGAQIEFIDAKHDDISPDAYVKAIDEETAIVPVTHICFKNGFRSDVARIAQAAHAKGALAFMDDYQDCGTRPIDVKALDVDFYVAGTLKYLLGASGTRVSLREKRYRGETQSNNYRAGSRNESICV